MRLLELFSGTGSVGEPSELMGTMKQSAATQQTVVDNCVKEVHDMSRKMQRHQNALNLDLAQQLVQVQAQLKTQAAELQKLQSQTQQ